MKTRFIALALVFGACSSSTDTPSDVAARFWDAARSGDREVALALSIPSENTTMNFEQSTSIESVTLGAVEAVGDTALVATTVVDGDGAMPEVVFRTVLARVETGEWKVHIGRTTGEMFQAVLGVSMDDMVQGMGEALAEGFGQVVGEMADSLASGMAEGVKALGDAMVQGLEEAADQGRTNVSRTSAPIGALYDYGVEEPWSPEKEGTVSPGMTLDEVEAAWGKPAVVRENGRWTYAFYRNGCERRCGTFDVVFLQDGQVVDAVVRSDAHRYSGMSSSPPNRAASFTPVNLSLDQREEG